METILNKQQALMKLNNLTISPDCHSHTEADHILFQLLLSEGYVEVCKAYNRIPRNFSASVRFKNSNDNKAITNTK